MEGGLLRRIARIPKLTDETAEEYMRRSTKLARKIYFSMGFQTIEEQLLCRHHKFAAQSLQPWDGSSCDSFFKTCLHILPESDWRKTNAENRTLLMTVGWWRHLEFVPWSHRTTWHRVTTWEDLLIDTLGIDWRLHIDPDVGNKVDRIQWAFRALEHLELGGDRLRRVRHRQAAEREKKWANARRRAHIEHSPEWRVADRSQYAMLVDIKGDNDAVVGQINGTYICSNDRSRRLTSEAQRNLWSAWKHGAGPATAGGDWLRHEIREGNKQADALATACLLEQRSSSESSPILATEAGQPIFICAAFDGGLRDGHAASAWLMEQWDHTEDRWVKLQSSATYHHGLSAAEAEGRAALGLTRALAEISCSISQ